MCKTSQGEDSAQVSLFCKDKGIVAVKCPGNSWPLWCLDTNAHLQ